MILKKATENSLVLKLVPLSAWIVAIIILVIVINLLPLGSDRILTCNRSSNLCVIYEKLPLLQAHKVTSFPVTDLREAKLTRNYGHSTTYGIDLVLTSTFPSPISLTGGSSSSYSDKQTTVSTINYYIHNSSANYLSVHADKYYWVTLLILLIFGGVAILLLINAKIFIIKLDKMVNQAELIWLGITGKKTLTYRLDEIVSADIITEGVNRTFNNKNSITYNCVIKTKNETIPVMSYFSGGWGVFWQDKKFVDTINAFLQAKKI